MTSRTSSDEYGYAPCVARGFECETFDCVAGTFAYLFGSDSEDDASHDSPPRHVDGAIASKRSTLADTNTEVTASPAEAIPYDVEKMDFDATLAAITKTAAQPAAGDAAKPNRSAVMSKRPFQLLPKTTEEKAGVQHATDSQQSSLEDSMDAALTSITKDGTRDDDHQAKLRAMYLAGFQAASQANIPNNYGGPPNSIDDTQNQQAKGQACNETIKEKDAASVTASGSESGHKRKRQKTAQRKCEAKAAPKPRSKVPSKSRAPIASQACNRHLNIDYKIDVILGEANDYPGMKHFCYLLDRFGHHVDDDNRMDRAKEVLDNIDGRLLKRDGNTSRLVELPKAESLELIGQSFGRKHVVEFDPNKDVLKGRGEYTNKNPANTAWRDKCQARARKYLMAKKRKEKTDISIAIVKSVFDEGGRFLTNENSIKANFYEMSEEAAVRKTSQVLRQMAKDLKKSAGK